MKLYLYDHCPFSMRPRLVAGLHNYPIEICVLRISDFETPEQLVGKKIVPILEKNDGSIMTESIDIALYLDSLGSKKISQDTIDPTFDSWKNLILNDYISLTSPLFIHSCREFQSDGDIKLYQAKEEDFLKASFNEVIDQRSTIKNRIETQLPELNQFITSPNPLDTLTLTELALFPFIHHLKTQVNIKLTDPQFHFWNQLASKIPV
jgi:glutaredoxin 2